jgi:hypothetical protein
VVTQALSANDLVLIDATSLVASLEEATVDVSDSADLQMLDSAVTQHLLTPTASTMTSMFATDTTAIRVVVRFGIARVRTGGVARLTGTNW